MKLCVVFPVMNQPLLAEVAINWAFNNLTEGGDCEFLILDNASKEPFKPFGEGDVNVPVQAPVISEDLKPNHIIPTATKLVRTVRLEKNIGVYPIFWEALKHTDAEVIAFLHTDLIIAEKYWDFKVMHQFINNAKLGLLGFIGSNEIDASGGRGLGTTSNFQGLETKYNDGLGHERSWKGSPASAHGKVNSGYSNAAVVDGCAMIFRRSVLEWVKQRGEFPPHHFYDRLLSSETREIGFEVGVLGIACDHISGQTVNQEEAYQEFAKEWVTGQNEILNSPMEIVKHADGITPNWDATIYKEAERQWLSEYRDQKHLVPCRV